MTNVEVLRYLHKIDAYSCVSGGLTCLYVTLSRLLSSLDNFDLVRRLLDMLEEDLTELYICSQYLEMEGEDEMLSKVRHIIALVEQVTYLLKKYLNREIGREHIATKVEKLVRLVEQLRDDARRRVEELRLLLPKLS